MYRDHSVAVVVPAYNEEGFVGGVIESIPSFVDRVYAVDDRSSDGTWHEILRHALDRRGRALADRSLASIADTWNGDLVVDVGLLDDEVDPLADGGGVTEERGGDRRRRSGGDRERRGDVDRGRRGTDAERPLVVPIRHGENRGVGAAITTGYRRARRDGIEVTAVMAGDGQMDPAHLDRLLDPIVEGRAGYAKGNRLLDSSYATGMSSFRLFGNLLLSFLTKVASGYWQVLDPQNGYTAISLDALRALDLDDLYEEYGFTNDLLVRLNAAGFRVADVAMPAVYGDEESHIRYRTFVPRLSWLLLDRFCYRLRVKYLRTDFHPLALLYGLGAIGGGIALLGLAGAIRARSNADSATGAALSAVVLAVVSVACLLLAMTFDREANEELVVTVR